MSLHIDNRHIDLSQHYPDGTPLVKLDHARAEYWVSAATWLLRPESWGEFWTAMALAESLGADPTHGNPRTPQLLLPLVPGSRQDRAMGAGGDQLDTLRTVCRAVNQRGFNRVSVFDPHSSVTPALLDRCVVSDITTGVVRPAWSDVAGVIAPDAGAERRASAVAAALNVPLVCASKHRDPATGRLSGFSCPPLGATRYLVVDDLCDGGGTFLGLADAIHAAQPDVLLDLYVSHGLFTQGVGALLTRYRHLYTTDSTVAAVHYARNNSRVTCAYLFTNPTHD